MISNARGSRAVLATIRRTAKETPSLFFSPLVTAVSGLRRRRRTATAVWLFVTFALIAPLVSMTLSIVTVVGVAERIVLQGVVSAILLSWGFAFERLLLDLLTTKEPEKTRSDTQLPDD